MQSLPEAVNCHAAPVGLRIHASKIKLMLTFIPAEQRQVVLFDVKLLEEVYQFEYLGSKLIASGQNNKEIKNRTTLSRLLSCLW